jgi:hypothetical protein
MSFDTSLMSISERNAFGVARVRPPPNRFPKTTRLGLVLEMVANSSDRVEPICQQAFVVQCQSWTRTHGAATRNSTWWPFWVALLLPASRLFHIYSSISYQREAMRNRVALSLDSGRPREKVGKSAAGRLVSACRSAAQRLRASRWTVAAAETCQSASSGMTARLLFSKKRKRREPFPALRLVHFGSRISRLFLSRAVFCCVCAGTERRRRR